MGYESSSEDQPAIIAPNSPDPYPQLLTQIARKIRRTLHLPTILQETVDNLGQALNISRCLLLFPTQHLEKWDVKAEFCQSSDLLQKTPCLGQILELPSEILISLSQLQSDPLIFDNLAPTADQPHSVMFIPTHHQSQRNGLIYLYQAQHYCYWPRNVLDFVQELAEQVGTAIAHATLYRELEQVTVAAQEASQLKSEFLASTTHELRTPLNGIIGFLKLVLDGMADNAEEEREFLEEAYQSALHLLNLINDILDLAKIEAGKVDLELSAVDLATLFQAVNHFAISQAQTKGLNFDSQLPETLTPITVHGNYRCLLQVMLNIVGNAIKFTADGEIKVRTEILKKRMVWNNQEFPGLVKVSITDTGIGVSLENQSKLFEKFVQIDGSRTKAYSGTGLGLAISQKLMEAMGGQVSFFSMGEGLGSTVTFSIFLEHIPIFKT
jgi:signal transduction histidine kinase